MANGLAAVVRVSGDRALAYCTGTTPDTGWVAGPAPTPPAYCAG